MPIVSSRLPLANGLLGLSQSHKIADIAEIYFRREPQPMKSTAPSSDKLSAEGTVSVELPADVVGMLKKEAKAHRRPIASVLREWLEDQIDAREAARRWKDIESGKTKTVPADEVYRRLGI